MKVEKKKLPLQTHRLKPIRREPEEPTKTGSIMTSDLDDSGRLKREKILALASDSEIDELWERVEPRVRFESEIVVSKCSRPACGFVLRIQRKKIGIVCPDCARRAYSVAGKEFEPDGKLEELKGKALSEFLKAEKESMEKEVASLKETEKASAILFRAGLRR